MKWLRHAFKVNEFDDRPPTRRELFVVERLCEFVVRRELTTPAVLLLESSQPLHYLSSQLLHFFSPFLSVLTDTRAHHIFARFLERRDSVAILLETIRRFEQLRGERPAGDGVTARP